MNLFFSSVAGKWAGVGRGFFLFDFASRKKLQSDRLYSFLVLFSFFLLQNILIFPFFLILPLAWKYTNKMDVSLLFVFNVIIIFCLIRQVHPSFRRRRLRKSVRPLPLLFLWGWMWWPAIKVSKLQSTVEYHRLDTMRTSINLPFFVSTCQRVIEWG